MSDCKLCNHFGFAYNPNYCEGCKPNYSKFELMDSVLEHDKQTREGIIDECIKKIEEFAECNEECLKEFYYGQGCKACLFGKIKTSIRGEEEENN